MINFTKCTKIDRRGRGGDPKKTFSRKLPGFKITHFCIFQTWFQMIQGLFIIPRLFLKQFTSCKNRIFKTSQCTQRNKWRKTHNKLITTNRLFNDFFFVFKHKPLKMVLNVRFFKRLQWTHSAQQAHHCQFSILGTSTTTNFRTTKSECGTVRVYYLVCAKIMANVVFLIKNYF